MPSTTRTAAAHWTDDEGKVRGEWFALAVIVPLAGILAALYFLIAGTRRRPQVAALLIVALVAQIAGVVLLAAVPA